MMFRNAKSDWIKVRCLCIALIWSCIFYNCALANNNPLICEEDIYRSVEEGSISGVDGLVAEIDIVGVSVVLTDKLNIVFYYNISEADAVAGNICAKVLYENGKTENIAFSSNVSSERDGSTVYGIVCKMSAKEINDIVSVQLWDLETNCARSARTEYSIKMYCDALAENQIDYCTATDLINALLVYGARAQIYFDYYTEKIPVDLTKYMSSGAEAIVDDIKANAYMEIEGGLPEGVRYHGCSLLLNSSIDYRLYFDVDSEETAAGFDLTESNRENVYYIEFSSIPITQLGKEYTVGIGNSVVKTTPMFFLHEVLTHDEANDESLIDLSKAIYDYYKAAIEYGSKVLPTSPITEEMRNAPVGSVFKFGEYKGNDIEWIVLENDGNKMYVVSKYALELRRYHSSQGVITWKQSELRNWLEGEFVYQAFTGDERLCIPYSLVNTNGQVSRERVTMLSAEEVLKYFPDTQSRICRQMEKAVCAWWLRDSVYSTCTRVGITATGDVGDYSGHNTYSSVGVRPAMWINLSPYLPLNPIGDEIRNASIGDSIIYGEYEQDGIIENGAEPIEWIVLSKTNNRLLVASKYVLDYQIFSKTSEMLDDFFYELAFSEEEKYYIDSSLIDDSYMKVFLLSYNEVCTFLPTNEKRVCLPTPYVISAAGTERVPWWLRTPGGKITQNNRNYDTMRVVNDDGLLENYLGSAITSVVSERRGIRPVMWLSFEP